VARGRGKRGQAKGGRPGVCLIIKLQRKEEGKHTKKAYFKEEKNKGKRKKKKSRKKKVKGRNGGDTYRVYRPRKKRQREKRKNVSAGDSVNGSPMRTASAIHSHQTKGGNKHGKKKRWSMCCGSLAVEGRKKAEKSEISQRVHIIKKDEVGEREWLGGGHGRDQMRN